MQADGYHDEYSPSKSKEPEDIASEMSVLNHPAGKYVIFIYKEKEKDSMQTVMDYIYKEWFPKSNCQLNENARVDLVRYGEKTDEKGESRIEVWIPAIS